MPTIPGCWTRTHWIDKLAAALQQVIPHNVLRFLEQQLKAGVCWVDLADKRMIWTDGVYDLFDYDRGVSPSRAALLDRMPPSDRNNREAVNIALQRRTSFDDRFRIILGDRRVRRIWAHGEFLFDAQGNAEALLVLLADLTAEQDQRDVLRTRKKHLQAIARLSRATVTTVSPGGKVTGVLHQQPFSLNAQMLETRSIEWVHPDDREALLKIWREAANSGEDFETEARICIPGSPPGWRRFRATAVRSSDGTIVEWLGLSFDINQERTGQALLNAAHPATGAQFRAARSLLRLSVQRLSELSGVSIAVIRRLEEQDGVPRDGSGESRCLRAEFERRGVVFIFPANLKPAVSLR